MSSLTKDLIISLSEIKKIVYDIEKTKRKRVPARAHFRFTTLLSNVSIPINIIAYANE